MRSILFWFEEAFIVFEIHFNCWNCFVIILFRMKSFTCDFVAGENRLRTNVFIHNFVLPPHASNRIHFKPFLYLAQTKQNEV